MRLPNRTCAISSADKTCISVGCLFVRLSVCLTVSLVWHKLILKMTLWGTATTRPAYVSDFRSECRYSHIGPTCFKDIPCNRRFPILVLHFFYNKYVRSPYGRTKIYAARMSHVSSSYRLISAAGPRPTSAVNPPAVAAAVDRCDRQKGG